ncbi:MAG: helix-turn-helix transcriptional regulator [Actinobacteria bacterium]|nr:helix-turn-helix transcriptional regulator [Actinomycetota bacterium]
MAGPVADSPGPGAELVARILARSGLTQAELARRAGIPRSVLNVYLHGRREPGADALVRLAGAGGFDLELAPRRPPVDPERAGKILVQVLELAEALPFRPRAEMEFPPLARRLAKAT